MRYTTQIKPLHSFHAREWIQFYIIDLLRPTPLPPPLTEEFIKVSQKIVKSSGADKESQITLFKTALDNFLIFSKLPLSDSSDYK